MRRSEKIRKALQESCQGNVESLVNIIEILSAKGYTPFSIARIAERRLGIEWEVALATLIQMGKMKRQGVHLEQ